MPFDAHDTAAKMMPGVLAHVTFEDIKDQKDLVNKAAHIYWTLVEALEFAKPAKGQSGMLHIKATYH